ncbi:hypothetical protein JYP49_21970 [Nitratireductor aquimarinus]|uniref:hypothetical protein n=1 Tax=Nitratireductor TaxID=245876 RepID=UPI0019D3878B|nr:MULTISPECIES: hypothetical protein [Nitratireductor]MBN7778938.1 hypothetical protein [Nitratireductor pacificus]MBN7783256.1 hypothetical protein [Nitratireductor pacificus]MBN7792060.1 hypothetical protein [Nitratireductor aquimarinus]MBY6101318.1 hypothetical protein [Nitratireductor aquimarinus]MCA1263150.1 hypothetical protein [Nitratireductor aquimarinus]
MGSRLNYNRPVFKIIDGKRKPLRVDQAQAGHIAGKGVSSTVLANNKILMANLRLRGTKISRSREVYVKSCVSAAIECKALPPVPKRLKNLKIEEQIESAGSINKWLKKQPEYIVWQKKLSQMRLQYIRQCAMSRVKEMALPPLFNRLRNSPVALDVEEKGGIENWLGCQREFVQQLELAKRRASSGKCR